MEIFLIRHPPPAIAPGMCYGQLDVALPDGTYALMDNFIVDLPRIDAVFSSPARRCLPLAAALATRDGSSLACVRDLQELHFGAWEGVPWCDIPRSQSDPWALDTWHRAPPDGETEAQLWQRVAHWYESVFEPYARSRPAERSAVVGHAGSLRVLRCLIAGLPAALRWEWRIGCGEIQRLTLAGPTQYRACGG